MLAGRKITSRLVLPYLVGCCAVICAFPEFIAAFLKAHIKELSSGFEQHPSNVAAQRPEVLREVHTKHQLTTHRSALHATDQKSFPDWASPPRMYGVMTLVKFHSSSNRFFKLCEAWGSCCNIWIQLCM